MSQLGERAWTSTPESRARTRARLDRAVRRREALIVLLAPDLRCAECEEQRPVDKLIVDHVDGITWDRSRLSPQTRAAKYFREFHAGIPLRALCVTCSCRDGHRRRGTRRW